MAYLNRNQISWRERYRRSFYSFLRGELDELLIRRALIESYEAFQEQGKDYPFVEMRELKPRAKAIAPEHPEQQHFIVIFNEEALPADSKNYIRFFDSNMITKENLSNIAEFDLTDIFRRHMRFLGESGFEELLVNLLKSDFAVLIQRDPSVKARYRYGISHFHVRIDWPVAEAAEDLAKHLRYISKSLYEKEDREAELLQQKLYEYYSFHHTVGGRRTAALVAAQFMSRFDFLSTVYVASSEARTLTRISEHEIAKYVLVAVPVDVIKEMAKAGGLKEKKFISSYLIDMTPSYGVGIFLVTYRHNESSTPPIDGKLRDINAEFPWLRVDSQLLIPPPSNQNVRPIPYSIVYS